MTKANFSADEQAVSAEIIESGAFVYDGEPQASPVLSPRFLKWLITDVSIIHPVIRIEGCTFVGNSDLRAHECAKHFEFNKCEFKGELDFRHLRVRQLHLNGSVFREIVRLNGARLDSGILANGARFKELVLQAAELGGNLELMATTIEKPLRAYQLEVKKSIFIRDGAEILDANFINLKVGSICQFAGAKISGCLDLTGADVVGELLFGRPGQPPIAWDDDASLSLRNAKLGALGAKLDDFKSKKGFIPTQLSGLSFDEFGRALGGDSIDDTTSLANEPPEKLLKWLNTSDDRGAFDPKPYNQVAEALERAGRLDSARRVKLGATWRATFKQDMTIFTRLARVLSGVFIGFGFAPWRALSIFLFVFLAGAFIAFLFSYGWDIEKLSLESISASLRISLSNSIPVIDFASESHGVCQMIQRSNCDPISNFNQLIFDAQRVFSLILASYFIAAISGFAASRR